MILSIVTFLIILGILVFVHELGHFAVAKWCGMRVDEFGLGFPPHIWTKKKGDTLYCLNAIPFGGYVKIHGEAGEEEGDTDPRSFDRKPVLARMAVILAGVTMNMLFAFVTLVIAFSIGFVSFAQDLTQVPGATVKKNEVAVVQLQPDSPAEQVGIKPGDYLRSFVDQTTGEEKVVATVNDLGEYTRAKRAEGHNNLLIRYTRDGENKEVAVTLSNADAPLGVFTQPVQTVRVPVWRAPEVAIKEIGYILSLTWDALMSFGHKLFTQAELDPNVSGPIGIYQATDSATRTGFISIVFLTVALSINLAVFNILPIPALDGGKFIFLLLEGIFGKKAVNRDLEGKIGLVSFFALIALILILSIRDVRNLF